MKILLPALMFLFPTAALASSEPFPETLELLEEYEGRVLGPEEAALVGVQSGFETGQVVEIDGVIYLFVNEMFGRHHHDMRISLWSSEDGEQFERLATIKESIPGRSQRNFKTEVWVTGVMYDEPSERWNLFYVAYQAGKSPAGELHADYNGRIFRAVSQQTGRAGIAGPYLDVDVVLRPDDNPQDWEGQQSVACFHPYEAGGRWYAFFCGHWHDPFRKQWPAGLAVAPDLFGPWRRAYGLNPSPISDYFIENPIVSRLENGKYLAVFDTAFADGDGDEVERNGDSIGYSVSEDGIHWPKMKTLNVQRDDPWSREMRTPLGLIENDDGSFLLYYTAREKEGLFWSLDRVRVNIRY